MGHLQCRERGKNDTSPIRNIAASLRHEPVVDASQVDFCIFLNTTLKASTIYLKSELFCNRILILYLIHILNHS